MFLAPKFFWGSAPELLEWDYKIQPVSDHVAIADFGYVVTNFLVQAL